MTVVMSRVQYDDNVPAGTKQCYSIVFLNDAVKCILNGILRYYISIFIDLDNICIIQNAAIL